jgi:putative membrane protein
MSLLAAVDLSPIPHWVPHPEVWLLLLGLVGLRLYAGRVIGPKVVPAGTAPFNLKQNLALVGGVIVLWISSDWPLHEIAEQRLYSAHMFQHLLMTMLVPPLLWLATPEWLARLVVRSGSRGEHLLHTVAKPLVALLIFNAFNLLSHWPWIVTEAAVGPGTFHYGVHLVLVSTAFIMWIPVCGPWKELRLTLPGQMVYLFAMSIFPTLPAAMLANSDTVVYTVYNHEPRLWGISVLDDQVAAGLVMKLAEVSYLWVIITVMFFKWAGRHLEADRQGIIEVDERELMDGNAVSPVGHG